MHNSADRQLAENSRAVTVLVITSFIMFLNETLMGVALPTLMAELKITPVTGQWLTTGFLLTMSVVIPITGILIQRVTTKRLYYFAAGTFLIGTALCAFAPSFVFLLIGRIVQAVGTAIISPLLLTVVVTVIPAAVRGRFMGRISAVMSLAPAIGPAVSGLLLSVLGWRALFLVVLPIATVVAILGVVLLRNVGETKPVSIDVLSVVLAALGFSMTVYGLSQLGEAVTHQQPIPPWLPILIGVITIALLCARQLRLLRLGKQPLLDLRVFQSRVYRIALAIIGINMMALFAVVILLPIFAVRVLGLEPLQIGLILLPGGILMGVLGLFVGRLVDRFGSRPLLLPGMLTTACALLLLAFVVGENTQGWQLLLTNMLLSFGLGLSFTPLFSAGLGALKSELASYGTAIYSTVQQVAGAAGTAVAVTIYSLVFAAASGDIAGVDPAATASGTATAELLAAEVTAVRAAFLTSSGLALTGFLLALFMRERTQQSS